MADRTGGLLPGDPVVTVPIHSRDFVSNVQQLQQRANRKRDKSVDMVTVGTRPTVSGTTLTAGRDLNRPFVHY